MSLPDEVYISADEALPRHLFSECAKHGCSRCGSAGWFWYVVKGERVPFMCPCASTKVRAKVDAAKVEASKPIEQIVRDGAAQMLEDGQNPVALILHPDQAKRLRAAVDVSDVDGEWFRVDLGSPMQVVSDANAPAGFARLLCDEEWTRFEPELRKERRRSELKSAAALDAEAAARSDLEAQRAAMVAGGDL